MGLRSLGEIRVSLALKSVNVHFWVRRLLRRFLYLQGCFSFRGLRSRAMPTTKPSEEQVALAKDRFIKSFQFHTRRFEHGEGDPNTPEQAQTLSHKKEYL